MTALAAGGSGGCESASRSEAPSADAKTRRSAMLPAKASATASVPPMVSAAGAPLAVLKMMGRSEVWSVASTKTAAVKAPRTLVL